MRIYFSYLFYRTAVAINLASSEQMFNKIAMVVSIDEDALDVSILNVYSPDKIIVRGTAGNCSLGM